MNSKEASTIFLTGSTVDFVHTEEPEFSLSMSVPARAQEPVAVRTRERSIDTTRTTYGAQEVLWVFANPRKAVRRQVEESAVWTGSQGDIGNWMFVDSSATKGWLAGALSRLDSLRELPDGWDGYGSPSIAGPDLDTLRRVLLLIADLNMPVPSIGPTAGGGIEIEWQYGGLELDFEIQRRSSFVEYLQVRSNGEMSEGVCHTQQRFKIRELAQWLLGNSSFALFIVSS